MRWFALLTLIVLSTNGWAGSNAEAEPTGTIAFVRGEVVGEGGATSSPTPGGRQVWTMRADGGEQRRLTRGRGWKRSPSWSPDGRKIAHGSPGCDEGGSHIFLVSADGRGEHRLTGPRGGLRCRSNSYHDQHWDWSPDGRRIVFELFSTDPDYAVYIVGADGSGERRLTPRQGYGFARPDWSPGGRLIAFTHGQRGAVYVMRPNGTGRRVLAAIPKARVWGVKWSPDGRLIAFISDDNRREELWIINADGTQPRRLVDARVGNRGWSTADFVWSPDSRQIAFTQCCREDEIFVVNADGSGLLQLTDNDVRVFDGHPAWSADGQTIAFTSDRDGNAEIYVMNADGISQRNVSQNPLDDFAPAWSPKG